MLDLVSQKVRSYESGFGTKQSCSYENIHFYKKLYFNPGKVFKNTSLYSTLNGWHSPSSTARPDKTFQIDVL
jgi:hypothetical protein